MEMSFVCVFLFIYFCVALLLGITNNSSTQRVLVLYFRNSMEVRSARLVLLNSVNINII